MARGVVLLTGFEPFGADKHNPSAEVASQLDGLPIGNLAVRSMRLPVESRRAMARVSAAIDTLRPRAVVGLGQAAGRAVICVEQVAVNLFDTDESGGGLTPRKLVAAGPDAYFTRLPVGAIVRALRKNGIPASPSLSAGIFVCNAVMYTSLHALRRRPTTPAGFIHLPYEAGQVAARPRNTASMSLEVMRQAVELALAVVVKEL